MNWHHARNNARSRVALPRAVGSSSLVVSAGDGEKFGTAFPIIVSLFRVNPADPSIPPVPLSILEVTDRTGDTLVVAHAIEDTTDVPLFFNDIVQMGPTALAISEIQSAVDVLKTSQTYVYTQSIPAATWTINHNLGRKPAVTVVDSADTVVIGFVQYLSLNSVQVTFAGGFSGLAYLN
jgi:hypothetical protein